jgi:DNA-binding transcriptional MerR regulator
MSALEPSPVIATPALVDPVEPAAPAGSDLDAATARMRIGEVAELTGTTPRTIRYYEERGLLGPSGERAQGKHRCYSLADVERIKEIVRLRDLLGLSLEELSQLIEAETARAGIRRELAETEDSGRRRELITQAGSHVETQLGLVQGRIAELRSLEAALLEKRATVARKLAELA